MLKLGTANLNLSPRDAALWGGTQFETFLGKTGYDGVELHPMRSRLTLEALLGKSAVDVILSTHQSFRSERWSDFLPGHTLTTATETSTPRLLAGMLAFPSVERSIAYLKRIQAHSPRVLPSVLYPNEQVPITDNVRTAPFETMVELEPKLWQPTAEVLKRWEIPTDDSEAAMASMIEAMKSRGFDGVCIDTRHWPEERYGLQMPAWEKSIPYLAQQGVVKEVHLNLSSHYTNSNSSQLQQVLEGRIDQTESGNMLTAVKDNLPVAQDLYVVTEVTADSVRALGYSDLVGPHRDIVEAVRGHVA